VARRCSCTDVADRYRMRHDPASPLAADAARSLRHGAIP